MLDSFSKTVVRHASILQFKEYGQVQQIWMLKKVVNRQRKTYYLSWKANTKDDYNTKPAVQLWFLERIQWKE